MHRIYYENEPTCWTRYCPTLMHTFTRIKKPSPRQKGRRTNHLFDWIAHSANLAKGAQARLRHNRSLCTLCGSVENKCHINTSCLHPPRGGSQAAKRKIDEFFLCYIDINIPRPIGVAPIIEYIEDHMWEDSVTGEDIWNGRWTLATLHQLLLEPPPPQLTSESIHLS